MKKSIISIILFIALAIIAVFAIMHFSQKEPTYQNSVSFNTSNSSNEVPTYVEAKSENDIVYTINKNLPIIIYSSIALLTLFFVTYIFLAKKKEW